MIVVHPDYGFGRPLTWRGKIHSAVIRDRWLAGESKTTLSRDYDLRLADIDEALDFERWSRRSGRYRETWQERQARSEAVVSWRIVWPRERAGKSPPGEAPTP